MRPGSKRTGPGRELKPEPEPEPEPGPAQATVQDAASSGARACGHGFPLIARENSKYSKGTPLVPFFLYLNTSNFHSMANVGLNAFSYL